MTSIDDELNAAKEAEAIIKSLSPSTHCDRETLDKLRRAYQFATVQPNFSSQTKLTNIRHDVVLKLKELCDALEKGRAAQQIIDAAKRAVEAWLKALAEP
jgi:hypothetical protein